MTLQIIRAEERLREQTGVKMAIFGVFGIGKTALLKTLTEPTLCLDMEAGLLSVQDWQGDSLSIRTWEAARDIACLAGGANPALRADQPYSAAHYERVRQQVGNTLDIKKYRCFFIDSITVASRLCLQWASSQPAAFSERTGKPDNRAAYGLLAQEMLGWIHQFQHIPNKDVIFVGLLSQKMDDHQQALWVPQCEGSKTALELPGIVDEVISLVSIKGKDNAPPKRAFVCQTLNPWEYPAKDRSGKLDLLEPPHLGKLLAKIKGQLPLSSIDKSQSTEKQTGAAA
jgi:hypothetical protein